MEKNCIQNSTRLISSLRDKKDRSKPELHREKIKEGYMTKIINRLRSFR